MSRRWKSGFAAGIGFVFITSASFGVAQDFNVISQQSNWSKTSIYPFDSEAEISIVETVLSRIKPLMREDLRDLLSETAMVINHSERKVTETYQGWGPEDDPEYIEGDTKLFGSENGSIKINITEKAVVGMALMLHLERLYPQNKEIAQALLYEWLSFFSHEVLHVKQFKTNPVFTLRSKEDCPQGDCNSDKLEGTKIKNLHYEGEALSLGRSIMMKERNAILAFADIMDEYESKNPKEFGEGGRWHLVSNTAKKNPFAQYYLRNLVDDTLPAGEVFTEATNRVYNGQWKPAVLVKELIQLQLNLGKTNLEDVQKQTSVIKREWAQFQESPESMLLHPTILASQPYQEVVQNRFIQELTNIEHAIIKMRKGNCKL